MHLHKLTEHSSLVPPTMSSAKCYNSRLNKKNHHVIVKHTPIDNFKEKIFNILTFQPHQTKTIFNTF